MTVRKSLCNVHAGRKLPDKEFSLPQNRQSYSCPFTGDSISELSLILLPFQHRAKASDPIHHFTTQPESCVFNKQSATSFSVPNSCFSKFLIFKRSCPFIQKLQGDFAEFLLILFSQALQYTYTYLSVLIFGTVFSCLTFFPDNKLTTFLMSLGLHTMKFFHFYIIKQPLLINQLLFQRQNFKKNINF